MHESFSGLPKTDQAFHAFFEKYTKYYTTPAYRQLFSAGSREEIADKFLDHVQRNGPNLVLFRGAHSENVDNLWSNTTSEPIFTSVDPFQSAQYALQRAVPETRLRRLSHDPPVSPVLIAMHVDLRGLSFETFTPSPYAKVNKDVGIGITVDIHDLQTQRLFEIQIASTHAKEQLLKGAMEIVASGENLITLLRWSKSNLGPFPLQILLPK